MTFSGTAGATLLSVRHLTVEYATVRGSARAVDDVSLDVNRAEIVGIAGESGCGKTTLTSAILRLTRPPGRVTAGSISLFPRGGAPVELIGATGEELRSVRWRNVSYVPQGSMNSLNPVMRVGEQFKDAITHHDGERAANLDERISYLLDLVGLGGHVARMYPHELSGGMRQRAIIAMAIALEPDLVIADEPTTALDVNVQRVIIQTLRDLRDRLGMSLVVVTHDMAVHAQLADRVAVMYAGKIVEDAGVRAIFHHPRHPYVRRLIGAIPRVGGSRSRLDGIDGAAPSPLAWPAGCRFHPRCADALPECSTVMPLMAVTGAPNGQHLTRSMVACHLHPADAIPTDVSVLEVAAPSQKEDR
ncbi:MAG: ABC transporter ATP-binding protein [Proteobacteria bacterium]|nr:ABC transporter ATP-binding protein [Actinomycetota bacterium]NBY46329.1 ABC transporter ATP-binding protein [Pseudomonadota bacterium]